MLSQSLSRESSRPIGLRFVVALCCAASGFMILDGCGSTPYTVGPQSGLPAPTPAASSNTYIGTQSPLNWTLTIDDTQNAFSYRSIPTDGSKPVSASGTFISQNNFLDLGASGLAVEIPGVGAVLRPGDSRSAPVFLLEQGNCFALSGNQRYLLEGMVDTTVLTSPATVYRRGDVVATTSADGKTWTFTDAEYFDSNGAPYSIYYQGKHSPNAFTGTCAGSNGTSLVSIDSSGAYNIPTAFHFGPAGMVVADYATYPSAVGFAQPLNPIDAKALVREGFSGFQVEYSARAITRPVSFGPALDGSYALNGGTFPNDDITQTADTSDVFQFGPQNSQINGLFANATMTVLDPLGGCALNGRPVGDIGLTPNGIPTCRLHLVALAARMGGKTLIIASGPDFTVPTSAPDVQFYLVQ